GAEESGGLGQSLVQVVREEAKQAMPALLAEGNTVFLEERLELCLRSEKDLAYRNYAAFLLLSGRLDDRIAEYRRRAEQPNEATAAVVLVYLYRAKGDLAGARWAAEQSGNEHLTQPILSEQADWKAIRARH